MLSRVVRFYTLGWKEVMGMPVRAFWVLVGNLHKIEADEDRRALRIALASGMQAGEYAQKLMEGFDATLNQVVRVAPAHPMEAKPDMDGIRDLKRLAGMLG